MQNKPNFRKSQMNVNPYNTTDYERKRDWTLGESKPNSNPISSKAKMNLKSLAKKSGHTPAYTVRQLFDIVVLYKYHLPIINPFTPLLGQPNENHP